jgi:hypothetical protein
MQAWDWRVLGLVKIAPLVLVKRHYGTNRSLTLEPLGNFIDGR